MDIEVNCSRFGKRKNKEKGRGGCEGIWVVEHVCVVCVRGAMVPRREEEGGWQGEGKEGNKCDWRLLSSGECIHHLEF